MTVIGIIIGVLLLLGIAAGYLLSGFSMQNRPQSLEASRAWQEEHYDFSFYDALDKTEYTVQSGDGYVLHALFLRHPHPTGKYILISHGYTDTRFGALKYAPIYLQEGFSIIAYDLRGHGANEATFCTYSIREREDLWAMIRDSRQRYPDARVLGIHGESLGAATSVAVLEKKPDIDFVTADCGFCDIVPVFKVGLKSMHLPGFLVYLASAWSRIRFGYAFSAMRPIDSLKDNTIPILFMHGAEDHFIVPEHSKRMSRATAGYSEVHLIDGAEHARSVLTDPKRYAEAVHAFLEKISKAKKCIDR